jgi:hypothetical protein
VLLRQATGRGEPTSAVLDWVLDTLIAVGAVGPDDAAVGQSRAVSSALGDGRMAARPSPGVLAQLGEPWHSALSRRAARSRRNATVAVAVDAALDGARVTVYTAGIDEGQLSVDLDADGPLRRMDEPQLPVTVRGTDDVGNHYLARLERWETLDEGRVSGQLAFWPALDDSARELQIILAGDRERATIRLELPEVGS